MNNDTPPYVTMIRDLPAGERPRERLRHYGPQSLNNADLLAILLRTGMQGENVIAMAHRLISNFKGLEGLGKASFTELTNEKGVSEAKACQLMAALELGRRAVSLAREDKPLINHPRDIYNLLGAEMSGLDQEHIKVVLLNTRNEVMSVHEIYKGNVHTAIIRVAEVLRPAIRENAPAMVAVHNHPTGDPEPSSQDVGMTVDVRQAAELLDIELVDHVIIGKGGRFSSLKEHNLGFH
jgi:DNA repair protein RadC